MCSNFAARSAKAGPDSREVAGWAHAEVGGIAVSSPLTIPPAMALGADFRFESTLRSLAIEPGVA
jgi:hypothetical protein